jgi:hypothetical protein
VFLWRGVIAFDILQGCICVSFEEEDALEGLFANDGELKGLFLQETKDMESWGPTQDT